MHTERRTGENLEIKHAHQVGPGACVVVSVAWWVCMSVHGISISSYA